MAKIIIKKAHTRQIKKKGATKFIRVKAATVGSVRRNKKK